ncbi:hypothetical protein CPB97_007644 [Podila verticillata]|nr:hypothetical protein CPB97_007644 [Podila verticillata]
MDPTPRRPDLQALASVDDTPAASVASSSTPSSPTSTANRGYSWASESGFNASSSSPFAHPLDASTHHPLRVQTRGVQNPYSERITTPGEEMVFDRGLLFASHRPSTHSDPLAIISAPLPTMPPINRSNSETDANNSNVKQGQEDHQTREIRSTPISLPIIVQPSPVPSNSQSYGSSSRTPSPNSHHHHHQHLSPAGSSVSLHQQYSGNNTRGPYTLYSAPAAFRPDSVCSFPDSSPLMAPNVLAAVDARLRASNNGSPRPSLRTPNTQYSSDSGLNSQASSLAPIITHHTVLQNTEAITSREQLYDILNRDEDDEGDANDRSGFSLGKPRPKFHGGASSRSSNRSSRRNSISSSLAHSGIELNHKRSSVSVSRPAMARGASGGPAVPSAVAKGANRSRDATAAMAAKQSSHNMHSLSSLDTAESSSGLPYVEKSEWLKSKSRTSRKWRSICCVVGILAFIGVIAGITLGFVTRKDKIDGLAPPVTSVNPGDKPTKPPITEFTPDPNLRKAFYGLDYNPAKAMMPWCGVTLQMVIDDVILMSQIANRIRLYGMDCGQADLTFQALKLLKIRMGVVLTIWVDKDPVTYKRQYDTLFQILDMYGVDMVEGVSVGNEVIFRGDQNITALGAMMADVRAEIKKRYPTKAIPVFSSEIGNNLNGALAAISDEMSGNLHPYFADMPAAQAANWTLGQYSTLITDNPTKAGYNGSISEVGWPSSPESAVYKQYAVPSIANMQTVVDTFVCQANAAHIPYYWFEFRDEPWKTDPKVPVEPFWGLFDKDNKIKIKIPNCLAP